MVDLQRLSIAVAIRVRGFLIEITIEWAKQGNLFARGTESREWKYNIERREKLVLHEIPRESKRNYET